MNGSISSHVVPKTTGTYNLGSSSIGYLGAYQSAGASYTFSWLGSTSASASYTLMVPTATGVIGQGMVVSATGVLSWKPQQTDTSAKSDAYVILDNDGIRTVLVTTGASDRDVTLPTAADNTHRIITVKKVDSGAGKVTVKSDAAGETIDGISGTTGINLIFQTNAITLQCDGSDWHILDHKTDTNWIDPTTEVALTYAGTAATNITSYTTKIKRVGDSLSFSTSIIFSGAANAVGEFRIVLPNGLSIDTTKITAQYKRTWTAILFTNTKAYLGIARYYDANNIIIGRNDDSGAITQNWLGSTVAGNNIPGGAALANNNYFSMDVFDLPISGWGT